MEVNGMEKYGIVVVQNLYQDRSGEIHNEYHIYTESGFHLGVLRLPSDGQYVFDSNFLIALMKGLAIRYGFIKPKKRS
jgi:hypothetical protein